MLSYQADDRVGANIHDIIHPDDLREHQAQMPSILSGDTVLLERRLLTSSGKYLLFEGRGRLLDENREKAPLTMILGDIDYLKQFNDLYGHQEGDSCLITIARTLAQALHRQAELVSQFGGVECVILRPNTPRDGGKALAEEIRRAVIALRIHH